MGKPEWIGYGRRQALKDSEKSRTHDLDKHKEFSSEELAKIGSAGSVEKIEKVHSSESSETDVKPSRKKKLSRHCHRFWCCYCIGLVIFLAIFLPIFFLLIIPAIAQRMVDSTSLPIHSVSIMNPTPNSTVLSLTASLKIPPPFKVRLEPLTLQLYRPETKPDIIPYVNFALAEQWVKGNTTISVVNQTVEIADKKEFIEFLRGAVLNEKFVLAARGETTAHLGKLKAKVKLDKEIELLGLNKLSGFSINSASLLLAPEEDGSNLLADLTIPNLSIVSFELGNETLNINGPNGLILGNATIKDVYVRTGNNTYSARGYIDLRTILLNLESIVSYTASALAQGNLQLGASGNQTVYGGEHIDYYEDILNQLQLTGTIPLISLLAESFSHLMSGGLGGIKNLTETLGVNLTQILEILNGGGMDLTGTELADLSTFLDS